MGDGCCTVGRAVVSDSKGPWFESYHQHVYQTFLLSTEKSK